MGLFDALTNGTQGYGGLLDFLQNMQMQQQPTPSSGFSEQPRYNSAQSAYDPPASFAQRFDALPNAPQGPATFAQRFDALPPAEQPPMPSARPADAPSGFMQIGDYSMPQFGPRELYQPQQAQAQLPPNAQPTQGQTQPAPQEQPSATQPAFLQPQSPGGFGGAMRGMMANAHTGPIGALMGAVGGGMGMGQGNPQDVARQNLKAQYDALVPMLGQQKAMLAVMNPEAGKVLISEAMTNKEKFTKTGMDALGNEQYGFVNEREQTINGKPAGSAQASPDGIGQINHNLKGDAYLTQFPPEVQSQVKDYIAGKTVPTGNPRRNNIIKQIASKYGEDTGVAVDDATFAARKQMRTQLSSSAPSSLGGQINIGNTAAGHLADLAEQANKLGNVDMGIAPISHGINHVRGLGTEQAAKMEALKGAAQHYGQEITKFYAGSPGGVAERDRFIDSVSAAKTPKELAAVIETEAQLMQSRLNTLGDQIKGVLGPMASEYPVIRPDSVKAFKKIEETVGAMRGGGAAAAPDRGAVESEMRRRGLLK